MKKRTTLVLLILTLSIYTSNINVQSALEENDYRPPSLELTPHDPISITSDSGFEIFPGSGTEEDPHIIEEYNITTTNTNGVYISSTTKYFIVRNCYIDAEDSGIYINDVADGTAIIANNTCNNADDGILLDSSANSTIFNNTCNNNDYGGISFYLSENSVISNNTCSNNYYGIWLWDSINSTVYDNTFTNCGLLISGDTLDAYLLHTVESNWVNGKKLGFYTNLDSTTIAESVYGQLILVNCTNMTVRDQIINSVTTGLFLYYCTSSTIINNTCSNNACGIWLSHSNSSIISDNTCTNANNGIYLRDSALSTVINNTCSNSDYGISLVYSSSSTVINNTCNSNWEGISLVYSGSSTVAKNTCNNNNYRGIYLLSSAFSTVSNNTCSNNLEGIYLHYSDFCVVTYNLLQENEEYGIYSSHGSNNNLIHHNNFVDNNLGGSSQACDDGINNIWYDSATLEGNYLSDWSEIGSYSIDGTAESNDHYPLDEIVGHTTTEHTSIESTTDENPLNFTFTLLLLIVPLLLTRIISKKTKKK